MRYEVSYEGSYESDALVVAIGQLNKRTLSTASHRRTQVDQTSHHDTRATIMTNHFDEAKIRRANDGKFAVKGLRESADGTDADLSPAPEIPPFPMPGVYEDDRYRAIRERGEFASWQARHAGHNIIVNLGPDDADASSRQYGGDLDLDPNFSEEMCGDYSVGGEPSIRYTWATGIPERPYVSATSWAYIEAFYTGEDGERRQLERGDSYDEAVADVARCHAAWEIEYAVAKRGYDFETGSGYDAMKACEEAEPRIEHVVTERTEILDHHDPADPGGTMIGAEDVQGEGHDPFIYPDLTKARTAAQEYVQRMSAADYSV